MCSNCKNHGSCPFYGADKHIYDVEYCGMGEEILQG